MSRVILVLTKNGKLFDLVPISTDLSREEIVKDMKHEKSILLSVSTKCDKCAYKNLDQEACKECIDENTSIKNIMQRLIEKQKIKLLQESNLNVYNSIDIEDI
jgi:hypothetical protein